MKKKMILAAAVTGIALTMTGCSSHPATAMYQTWCAPGSGQMCLSASKITDTTLTPRPMLVQGNDLANLNSLGTSYTADFRWVTCGGNSGPCSAGDINSYTSEAAFAAAVAGGAQPPGSTALLDLEPWDLTPASESAHIEYYDKLATAIGIAGDITLILSPVDYADGLPQAAEAEAAYAGPGTIIEIQAQGHDTTPAGYYDYADPIVRAIRAQNKTVPIMLGIATDAGGWDTIPAATMEADYDQTYGLVSYFWENAATWTDPNARPCAHDGCPAVGDAFTQYVEAGG
jgi:hypothetical protein